MSIPSGMVTLFGLWTYFAQPRSGASIAGGSNACVIDTAPVGAPALREMCRLLLNDRTTAYRGAVSFLLFEIFLKSKNKNETARGNPRAVTVSAHS